MRAYLHPTLTQPSYSIFFSNPQSEMLSTLSPATLSRRVWEISLFQAIKSRGENYHTTSSQLKWLATARQPIYLHLMTFIVL